MIYTVQNLAGAMSAITTVAAHMMGYIGVCIMCFGALRGLVGFILCTKRNLDRMTEIRVDIAKHLSLGLEFMVAKDIIETVIHPTFSQLLLLLCIIFLRFIIAIILAWELREAVEEIEEEQELEEAIEKYKQLQKKLHGKQKKEDFHFWNRKVN